MHFKEKLELCFKKGSLSEVLSNLKVLIDRQYSQEMEAIYGGGEYAVSLKYDNLTIKDGRWHTWPEQRRLAYVDNFRKYTPNLSDTYKKPAKVGRKPNYVSRKRHSSEMIIDRVEEEVKKYPKEEESDATEKSDMNQGSKAKKNTVVKSDNKGTEKSAALVNNEKKSDAKPNNQAAEKESFNNSRIGDPKKKYEETYTLYLRSLVSKLVRKCFGQCGRIISQVDDGVDFMVVKSFGTSPYTDKNGKLQEKYGPQYIHFNEDCLLRYAAGQHNKTFGSFPFDTIKVDTETMKKLSEHEKDTLRSLNIKV